MLDPASNTLVILIFYRRQITVLGELQIAIVLNPPHNVYCLFCYGQIIKSQRKNKTGIISLELPPGCSHSLGSDSIWCAEPLNPILIPAKPDRQLKEPTASLT